MNKKFKIGDRVKVFCHWLFKDDVSTPLSMTMKEGVVTNIYDKDSNISGEVYHYRNLCSVKLDYDGRVSNGHFMWGLEPI